jgi:hypothetical protein
VSILSQVSRSTVQNETPASLFGLTLGYVDSMATRRRRPNWATTARTAKVSRLHSWGLLLVTRKPSKTFKDIPSIESSDRTDQTGCMEQLRQWRVDPLFHWLGPDHSLGSHSPPASPPEAHREHLQRALGLKHDRQPSSSPGRGSWTLRGSRLR